MLRFALTLVHLGGWLFHFVAAQTWCGKNYKSNESVALPGGQFQISSTSTTPLLAFQCNPSIRPYLADDASNPAGILIDTTVTYTTVGGAVPITLPAGWSSNTDSVAVTVSVDGKTLAQGNVPLNTSGYEMQFSLGGLQPQMLVYNVSCSASYSESSTPSSQSSAGLAMFRPPSLPEWADLFPVPVKRTIERRGSRVQNFSASMALSYLPNPTNGSVTKMDLRTGALLAKPADGSQGDYQPVFPIGFYTAYDGYLTSNLSVLNELKAQGFTVVHPIPPYDNPANLEKLLDHMQDVGLYLMYDMRFDYMNSTLVTEQVSMIKSRPNLLLWYTADEPDGTSDPLNATKTAYDLIYSLDGYHPVSLVLNCQDYHFADYATGADILLQDPYMIGNNVTFSNEWKTVCDEDFGCCGCDNCKGTFGDISTRIDTFYERLEMMGRNRGTVVWSVPQAFGSAEYWTRTPTGKEWVVQAVLSINHGALGIIPWTDPTTADIKSSASAFALSLPTLSPFLFSPNASHNHTIFGSIDVGSWTVGTQTLLVATNLEYNATTLDLVDIVGNVGDVKQVFDSGSVINDTLITFESVGSGAFILS